MAPMNFTWSDDKNYLIRRSRMIAFEDIAIAIGRGDLIDTVYDHNPERYPGQHLYLVMVKEYLYTVPFYQIDDETVRFVTAFPDGKRMRRRELPSRNYDSY